MSEFPPIRYYIYYDSPDAGYYYAEKNDNEFTFYNGEITTIPEKQLDYGINNDINNINSYKVIYSYENFWEILGTKPTKFFYTLNDINNLNGFPSIPALRFS